MNSSRLILPIFFGFLGLVACAPAHRATQPSPVSPAVRLAALDPRLTGSAPDPAALLEAGRIQLLETNRQAEGVALLTRATKSPLQRQEALLLLAHTALRQRDYPGLIDGCLQLLEEYPTEPVAELALWLARYADGNHAAFEERLVPALVRLLERPEIWPEVRWQATFLLARSCARKKDEPCWAQQLASQGVVRRWLAAGPFGVAPAIDFLEPLPEEGALRPGCRAPARPSRQTEICTQELFAPDGDIYCPRWSGSGGVCLLETWVKLEQPNEVEVRVLSSASFQLRLDDELVLEQDGFVGEHGNYSRRRVALASGWHHLRARVASSGWNRSLHLSLTGLDGRSLALTESASPPVEGMGPPQNIGRPASSDGRRWLEQRAEQGDPTALLFLATFLNDFPHNDTSAALRWARRLVEWLPTSAEARYRTGLALSLSPELPERVRQSLARQEFLAALALDESHLMAHFELGLLDRDADDQEAALDHFAACIRLAPHYFWPYLRRSQIQRDWGWDREVREDLERAAQLSPSQALARELESYWDGVKAYSRRDEARQRILAGTSELFPADAARWAEDAGQPETALQLWERSSQHETLSISPLSSSVNLAQVLGRRDRRDRALDEWERRAPLDPGVAEARIRALLAEGQRAEALAALGQLITRHPDRFENERLLAELRGQRFGGKAPDPVALLAKYREAQRTDPALQRWAAHDLVILWESRDDYLRGRGEGYRVVHRVSLIQTKAAADDLGEKRIPNRSFLLEFRTIKADGTILQPELGQGKGELSFSGVGLGDLIEYRYALPLGATFAAGGFFDRFLFQYSDHPIVGARLQVCIPEGEHLAVRSQDFRGDHESGAGEDGLRCERWTVRHVPAVESEPLTTPYPEWLPWVSYAYRVADDPFQEVQRVMQARVREYRRTSPELAATIATLLGPADQAAKLPLPEKVRRLYAWVRDEVRSTGKEGALSTSAVRTFSERKGNRTLLLSTLLQEAGVPHRILLARGARQEATEPPLPDGSWYSWPVLEVATAKREPILLDLNITKAPSGYLSPDLELAEALVIDGAAAASRIRLPRNQAAPRDRWRFELELRLDQDGTATGQLTIHGEGNSTSGLRKALPGADPQDRQSIAERLLSPAIPGISVTKFEVAGLEAADGPISARIQFASKDLAQKSRSGELRLPRFLEPDFTPIWAVGTAAFSECLKRMERKLPLLTFPFEEEVRVIVHAPSPLATVLGAEPFQRELPAIGFRVSQQSGVNGSTWTLSRHSQLRIGRLSPADFPQFRRLLVELAETRSRPFVLQHQQPMAGEGT